MTVRAGCFPDSLEVQEGAQCSCCWGLGDGVVVSDSGLKQVAFRSGEHILWPSLSWGSFPRALH